MVKIFASQTSNVVHEEAGCRKMEFNRGLHGASLIEPNTSTRTFTNPELVILITLLV
jgi:hypothetical protein